MGNYAANQFPENREPRPLYNKSWLAIVVALILIAGIGIVAVFDLVPASRQVEVIMSEAVACEISDDLATYDLSKFATEDARFEGFESFNVDLDLYESGSLLENQRLKVEPGGFAGLHIEAPFSFGHSPTCRLTIFGIRS